MVKIENDQSEYKPGSRNDSDRKMARLGRNIFLVGLFVLILLVLLLFVVGSALAAQSTRVNTAVVTQAGDNASSYPVLGDVEHLGEADPPLVMAQLEFLVPGIAGAILGQQDARRRADEARRQARAAAEAAERERAQSASREAALRNALEAQTRRAQSLEAALRKEQELQNFYVAYTGVSAVICTLFLVAGFIFRNIKHDPPTKVKLIFLTIESSSASMICFAFAALVFALTSGHLFGVISYRELS